MQSRADVEFIRRTLDAAGGHHIKIISKIENQAGLDHYDEILDVTDGAQHAFLIKLTVSIKALTADARSSCMQVSELRLRSIGALD